LSSAVALCGQTVAFAPASGRPGDTVAVKISLKSPEGKQPSTLQWQTTTPLANVDKLEETVPAPAIKAAGKGVTCAVVSKTAETYTTRCILAGGQTSIPDGLIAILNLKIAAGATAGRFEIRVDKALAVSQDLTRVEMPPTAAVITVR